jgi:hypothetical protein
LGSTLRRNSLRTNLKQARQQRQRKEKVQIKVGDRGAEGMAQAGQHLPYNHKALSSNSSTANKWEKEPDYYSFFNLHEEL